MYLKTYKKQFIISQLEEKFQKTEIPIINIGDSIKMGILIQEGNKERIQNVEGVVISKHNSQLNTTITIRKVLQNIGVERVYLIHSPRIKTIQIIKRAKVRRAKLYYLRSRSGKATRLKQKFN
uniref:Large ribosomal subunit protein bL19c n=1 Tax=Gracilariopsis longissima TaxID=172976 RepID=A0A345U9S4_9FLOR|nr:ribosomal protein L19 [Gracilariopsis longissima]AXI97210.1 ribosomal protein L19 [Gracilariopsis longissima]UAD89126.1 ribosomal protein L19 [Gracilariopsis longissima]